MVPGRTTDGSDEPTFHSPQWWQDLWTGSDAVTIEQIDMLPNGWSLWHRFCQAAAAWDGHDRVEDVPDGEMILADRQLGFVRLVGRRTPRPRPRHSQSLEPPALRESGPGGPAVRQRGDTVVRSPAPWTPGVLSLLHHLESAGVAA
jgi:hypothetical protein